MGTAAAIGSGGGGEIIGAGGLALASIGGSYIQSESSKSATKAQVKAFKEAQELQAQQFQETKALFDPFVSGGLPAFQRQQALSGSLGPEAQAQAFQEFEESPNVAFLREQGEQGVNRQAAARGGLGGASRLKAISQFNQGLAMQDFQNQFNRLGAVTGVGLGAASALTGAGAQAAAGQAQSVQQAGAATAAGQLQQGQIFASGLGQLGQLAGFTAGGGFGSSQQQQPRRQPNFPTASGNIYGPRG